MRTVLIMQKLTARSQLGPQLVLGGRLLFFTRLIVPGFAGESQGHGGYPLLVRKLGKIFILRRGLVFTGPGVVP